jgi:iron complex transport system substrate-binding protein
MITINQWLLRTSAALALAITTLSSLAQTRDVVVIGGGLTEIVYALGAEARLAAVDTTSMFPDAAKALPKVGYQRSLSAEGVLSLKPKLILAAGEAGPPTALAQIRSAGVPIESFAADYSASTVVENVRRVAVLLGIPREGERLAGKLKAAIDNMRDTVSGHRGPRPKVVFLLAHSSASSQVAGEGTAAHAIIELAGGENAMTGFKGYRPLTSEGVISAAPDVILISDQGLAAQGGIEGVLKKPGMSLTPAGRARRVVSMDALQLLGFTPRLPETVIALAARMREAK